MEIKEILNRLEGRGIFLSVNRHQYLDYDIEKQLSVFEKIGKTRNPKFVVDEINRFLYENLIRWMHGDPKLKSLHPITREKINGRIEAGIYIAGGTGTGKSWALEIASAYVAIYNLKIRIGEKDFSLRWENIRTDDICNEYARTGDLQQYKLKKLLGLQDLGAEQSESLYMGNRLKPIQQLIENRGDRTDVVTLITSNYPMIHDSLKSRYGDRVLSRLSEMCNYYELKGADRRSV